MEKQTTEQIVHKETLQLLNDKKVARMCANCTMYDKTKSKCTRTNTFIEGFKFCRSHEFMTEQIERLALEIIRKQEKECAKIENLLAMMITCAGMVTCVAEDFEQRTKKLYKEETDKQTKLLLRKDLNLSESYIKAFDTISDHLKKIDQQYRFYIYPYEKRVAMKEGKFDVAKADAFLSNQFELLRLLFKCVKKILGREDNLNKLYAFIDTLEDSPHYSLEDKDINHYKLK